MKQITAAFLAGIIFAIGLGISGMTDANIVIGFLNLAGTWDPRLAFVMVGAISSHMLLNKFIARRESPVYFRSFQLPTLQGIDKRLVLGSALFGIGWGLGGICPGPGIVSMASLKTESLAFAAAMFAGMFISKMISSRPFSLPSTPPVQKTALS
jgi:uncharacterized membrane protein YedE/YeeE